MNIHHGPFPYLPVVFSSESILGYLKRLAEALELSSVFQLEESLRLPRPLRLVPIEADEASFSRYLGDQWGVLKLGLTRRGEDGFHFLGQVVPEEALYLARMRICPYCISEAAYHRHLWHYAAIEACHRHEVLLLDSCTACGTGFSWHSSGMTRCSKCDHALADMTAKPAPREAVQVARLLLRDGQLAPVTEEIEVPELLQGLGFEETFGVLKCIGRHGNWAMHGETRGASFTKIFGRCMTTGYWILSDWPAKFRDLLHDFADRKGELRINRTANAKLNPLLQELVSGPLEGWGHRVRSELIQYIANDPELGIVPEHPLGPEVLKLRAYIDKEAVMELLGVDLEQFRKLRLLPAWSQVKVFRDRYQYGSVLRFKEALAYQTEPTKGQERAARLRASAE